MKKNLFTFLLALFPLFAFADAVEINGIYYNLIAKAKQAEVTSNPNKYTGSIVIPETVNYDNVTYSVTSIYDSAFFGCNGLTSVIIGNNMTSIGRAAFKGCTSLTSITIPNSVTSIGNNAFEGCSDLTSVTIGNSVTNIGNEAFSLCSGLTSVTIPNSVTSIGQLAFYNCTGLTSVTIPNSVTSIGNNAFNGCSGLTSITIPNSITSIGGGVFLACSGLTSVTIPNSVTSIDENAFYGCSGLTSITIPNSVTSIGQSAFIYCYGLISVTIGNSVNSIGYKSFASCTSLTSIIIGSGITSIGSQAFANCSALTDVFCYKGSVPTTESDAFDNSYVDYANLHVLASSVSAYSASAPWSGFGTIDAIASEDITIGDLGIGTFCGSNPIDLSGTEDVKAYVVSSYEKATGQVTLTRTYYVPPFTGVVVKGNKGAYTIPAGVGQPVYPNMMKGVTENTVINKVNGDYTNYVLANKGGNLGFYAVSNGSTLGAGKAYLPLPTDDLPSAARELTLIFDDGETTEIMKVVPQKEAPQGYYDLQGRRVANPTSGIYIVNGKKVIIK